MDIFERVLRYVAKRLLGKVDLSIFPVIRAAMWMPFITAILAVACVGWTYWAFSVPSYLMALPALFGVFVFTMTSTIGFYVRKKMIQAELLAHEIAAEALRKADQYFVEQVRKAGRGESLTGSINENDLVEEMNKLAEWQHEHTTTSRSS